MWVGCVRRRWKGWFGLARKRKAWFVSRKTARERNVFEELKRETYLVCGTRREHCVVLVPKIQLLYIAQLRTQQAQARSLTMA